MAAWRVVYVDESATHMPRKSGLIVTVYDRTPVWLSGAGAAARSANRCFADSRLGSEAQYRKSDADDLRQLHCGAGVALWFAARQT